MAADLGDFVVFVVTAGIAAAAAIAAVRSPAKVPVRVAAKRPGNRSRRS
jgi:hypothetical protein